MFEIFDWIPWTAPIAFVFIGLAVMITGLTIWGHYRPPVRRKGFLGLVTDRSERVYISIVSFALVMVISFSIVDSNTMIWAIGALAMSVGILKWG